jgi:signal transduction histidine kinase
VPHESPGPIVRWYRSFYWRVGVSFVVFAVGAVIAQSIIVRYRLSHPPQPERSPHNLALKAVTDLSTALTNSPTMDLAAYLTRTYHEGPALHVVMKDGTHYANRPVALDPDVQRAVERLLRGPDATGTAPVLPARPVSMAPIQVRDRLVGMVVIPPGPEAGAIAHDVSLALSLPTVLLLVAASSILAIVVFAPARRRLKLLERAAERLRTGESAEAPEEGDDEVARVAMAFNRMAKELVARDEALRRADRVRRQMVADVSHELKTPITAIRGYVETLHMNDVSLDRATRARYLETLERETIRLDRLVRDLLDLARLESGATELNLRVFATARLFEHVMRRHEHDAKARSIQLHASVTFTADQMVGDPDRLEQVIENLVANALSHTPDGGGVELQAFRTDGELVLLVADSGAGIPSEHLALVFDRFYKADAARSNGSGGSGLGLSIAKAIVEAHRGRIDVESRPGRTIFSVRLPQDVADQPASANL